MDDDFYIIFNAHHDPLNYKLPGEKYGKTWIKVVDSNAAHAGEDGETYNAADTIEVPSRSVLVLKNPIHDVQNNG